jgi:hypothetical protein
LNAIENIKKYSIQNSEYKRVRERALYQYMFEIVLKQDYEDLYFFREFEVNGVTNNPAAAQISKASLYINSMVSKGGGPADSGGIGSHSITLKYESPDRNSMDRE